MSRLIDADALIECLQTWKTVAVSEGLPINERFATAMIAQVNLMPTIEERKTGKWTNRWAQNGDQVKEVRECSECGAVYLRFYDTADGFDCVPSKYCPNCGADMRGDKDENKNS